MISRIGKCLSCKDTSRKDYTESRETWIGTGMSMRKAMCFGIQRGPRFVLASKDMRCPRCDAEAWNAKKDRRLYD